jgi:modulator of FtsH protease HflC
MPDNARRQHWLMIALILGIALILVLSLITFQVNYTEHAVVLRFGKPVTERKTSPGLHLKWPFETIWRIDNRIQCFEGNLGAVEEVFTRDGKNIVVTVYICWRVSNDRVIHFLERVKNRELADEELTALLRSYKNGVLGKYNLSDLININPDFVKIEQIEQEIFDYISKDALSLYGIDVTSVGIKHIGFPETVTTKVFDRMIAERETVRQMILSEGEAIAEQIRAEAEKESVILLADAENEAKRIRAEGDAEAAKHYSVFQKNPELAAFLRKLDSLRKTLSEKTVLILDTNTAPFDLFKNDALKDIVNDTGENQD